MKAVVFHGVGDIRLDDVPMPAIQQPTDAVVRCTASAICGTDLHMVRGTMPGMKPGTVLGHEAVGVVEDVGDAVRSFSAGDRVVVCSTIACGYCSYCRAGYYAQCDHANPGGPLAGTSFFGGPAATGGFNGLQAEYFRAPYAATGLVKLPEDVTDDQAILISDIFPTGYFGADMAHIHPGHTVAVFGCGPVGQFAILSAMLMDAGRVIAVDGLESRLRMARDQGAETVDYTKEGPVEAIRELTGGIGVDRAIDAVGVDAKRPHEGPAAEQSRQRAEQFQQEVRQIAPETNPQGEQWTPGDAPSQALRWAVKALAKAGALAIIGVYPQTDETFPIGMAMNKNISIRMGNCNHRKYVPHLVDLVRTGQVTPTGVLTQQVPLMSAIDAYQTFDQRQAGWMKVELCPPAGAGARAAA